ncbi:hypothetical protein pb186bvf_001118 [Paramecium bursaria]
MDEETYEKEEIVWAKIRGYPWWPGIVAKVICPTQQDPAKYLVNFIGDNSHSLLPSVQLAKYKEKYEEYYPKVKAKGLRESVAIADMILDGKTTYESEVKKIQQKKSTPKSIQKIQKSDSKKKLKRKDSSSSEDNSPSHIAKSSQRKSKFDLDDQPLVKSEKKKDESSLSLELNELIRILQEQKINSVIVENRVQTIESLIEKNQDQLYELMQSQVGRGLIKLPSELSKKASNGTRNLANVQKIIGQLIEKIKHTILKVFFDPTEIIEQLHQVSGQKKITQKLLEKLQNQEDWIYENPEDEDDSDESDQSESDVSSSSKESVQKPTPKKGKLVKIR